MSSRLLDNKLAEARTPQLSQSLVIDRRRAIVTAGVNKQTAARLVKRHALRDR